MMGPDDPLAPFVAAYDAVGASAIFLDAEWFHVAFTSEYVRQYSWEALPDPESPPHYFGPEVTDAVRGQMNTSYDRRHEFRLYGQWVLHDTPGGRDVLRSRLDPSLVDLVDEIEPVSPPQIFAGSQLGTTRSDVNFGGGRADMKLLITRLADPAGRHIGYVNEFRPEAGMSQVFSALALADLRHLDRMTAVSHPDRRPAAILFADLEASAPLSKRISTAQYFAFGRRMVRAVDQCLIDYGGIVGRHAGDGITGFFLAETAGSESAAARSCIEAARALPAALAGAVERSDLGDEQVSFRFGLHWGARLYVGRINSAGRSEVTALGDEVNDAARIEACATGGRTLASKDLVECLTAADAAALGIDLTRTKYTVLAELPTATDKARRDAPALAVCDV